MMQQHTQKMKQQKGIALIMVLLVVALVTIIATGIASNQKLSTRRTSNLLNNEQAYMYLLGAEDWAKDILLADIDPLNNTSTNNATEDSLNDFWNRDPKGNIGATTILPIDNGTLTGKIYDLQSRFNINNVINAAVPPQTTTPNPLNITMLNNLLREISDILPNGVTIPATTDAIVDWVDDDPNALSNGAEDGEYLNRPVPYVTPNHIMANASELSLVNGFSYESYKNIGPYVVALPESTALNINTVDERRFRVFIKMFIAGISDNDADAIIDARGTNGYSSVADFNNLPEVRSRPIDTSLIDTRSRYFLLESTATVDNSKARLFSVFYRVSQTDIRVILRSQQRITENINGT